MWPIFSSLSVSLDYKSLMCGLPQNDELGVQDNYYNDIIQVNVMTSQITGNLSKLSTKESSELRLTGALLGNLSFFFTRYL